ncbi:FAD:protein FMN transferase [Lysobacter fragariae]
MPPNAMHRARPLLGTVVAIRAEGDAELDAAIDAAFAEIEAVHRAMSFHDADAELSRVNREAARAPQAVGALTWRVLCASVALARASDGRFDPTIAPALVRSGHLPTPVDAPPPAADASWRDIELLPNRRVHLRKSSWLDLGGIAKGFAVDRAVAALRARGVASGVVNAGGDLRVFGHRSETITVRDPNDPTQSRPLLQLHDGAVATSAAYFSVDTAGRSALIDTRATTTLGHRASVSVCAPRAIWADALTKPVLADGEAVLPLLRRLRAQAVVLHDDGRTQVLQ